MAERTRHRTTNYSALFAIPKWSYRKAKPNTSQVSMRHDDCTKHTSFPLGICYSTCCLFARTCPTRTLLEKTPYEAWYGRKPDISHLHKFGTPIYVLLQPQKTRPKLAPRLKQQIFIGYDNELKSIRYFNPETRRILTSRNFQFLTNLPAKMGTPEPIQANQDQSPTMQCEGG